MTIDSVKLVRSGAALSVESGGRTRTLRWIDLAGQLGAPDPLSSRFTAARVAGPRTIEVELAVGGREQIELPEPAVLVVETGGLLMQSVRRGDDPLGLVRGGAAIAIGDRIALVGPREALGKSGIDLSRAVRIDAGDRLVTPGLVDCHAHPIFAGDRADEFARRARGQSYLEIAGAGGGIAATVAATRAASFEELLALTCARLDGALACGTTTMEAKSGYDLTVAGEHRMLEVAWVADCLHAVDLEPTLLIHVVPADRDRDEYVAEVCREMIPRAAAQHLCPAIDVYCDQGAFTLEETRRILEAGKKAGLLLRAHVGQFADLGAAPMLAELGGLSVDHVEQIAPEAMRSLAAHGVVAVMLPGACVQLRLAPPPVAALREARVEMAIATDMNPGSSLCESLPLQMWLACTHYGMTVDEAWLGVTRHAGRALGLSHLGGLAPAAAADFVVWDAEAPAEIPYRYGAGRSLVHQVVKSGRVLG